MLHALPKKHRKKLKKLKKKAAQPVALVSLLLIALTWLRRLLASNKDQNPVKADPLPTPADPLQRKLAQARDYEARIANMVRSAPPGSVERRQLEQVSERVRGWTQALRSLVEHLRTRRDPLLDAQRRRLPGEILELQQELRTATDETLAVRLSEIIEARREQLQGLQRRDQQIRLIELKIDHVLTRLGTLYTELQAGWTPHLAATHARLSGEIDSELAYLRDYQQALVAVQQGSLHPSA